MDPYLERHWRDVHTRLIAYSSDALQSRLPNDLLARMEEREYVETQGVATKIFMSQVKIVEDPSAFSDGTTSGGGAFAQPLLLQLEIEPVIEPYIVITAIDGHHIVTVIEFLSPSNKVEGEGRETYLKKRREMLASDATFVEIDLVRGGEWVSLLTPYHVPAQYRTTYRVCIRRNTRREKAYLYPITLRQKLPAISIPLRPADENVPLDLQSVFEQAWRNGR